MKDRNRRKVAGLAAFGVAAVLAAYGCGDSGTSADGEDGGLPLGPDATTSDGTLGPGLDGSVPGKDGASIDGNTDGANDAATDADAEVDSGDSGVVDPPGPLSPTYVDYAINHILVTGQSNSIASGAHIDNTVPAGFSYTATQPYNNLMFDVGVMTSRGCNGGGCPNSAYVAPAGFAPLIEGDSFFTNSPVESNASSMANQITSYAANEFMFGVRAGYPASHDILVSNHGRSGQTYTCLRKGSCAPPYKPLSDRHAFAEGILQVEAGKTEAAKLAKSHVVRAVTVIHGESDQYAYTDGNYDHNEYPLNGTDGTVNKILEYDDAMIEWQVDYETSIKAVTGQAQPVPLFIMGVSGFTRSTAAKPPAMKVATYQLSAHKRAPGKVVLVAPGYIFDMAWTRRNGVLEPECLHYSIIGERQIGEYFAKAYAQVVLRGQPWEPVHPKTLTRAANVVTVTYHVPKPPLVFDTTRVSAIAAMGFEFFDGATPIPITNVAVAGETVTITLQSTPASANKRLQYANNQPYPGCIGPGTKHGAGARGNLRDSDDTPSLNGFDLFNWGVTFDLAVP